MDEAEWLACNDSRPMLEFLREKVSERKLRLFAVGCCRRSWQLLTHPDRRKAVEVGERYADGTASREECLAAQEAALDAIPRGYRAWPTAEPLCQYCYLLIHLIGAFNFPRVARVARKYGPPAAGDEHAHIGSMVSLRSGLGFRESGLSLRTAIPIGKHDG
jgi:hypothetical protein